ncbi:BMP family ABC transporter substrate-binding protein [Pseudooceanicola sp. CBS1P-1]|uniref:BMP family ABC transporter substrate-binding protein n=1 Tax=Pseudooceanicola albus TaxID=2692189 RepID=A0A6L7G7W9_9RHOB|nr:MULTISPECIES: BMP family ABC transporter substrate-binding protein [Pseudooceanicola]MBT9385941.1 BMP family ABC transporter substrate-binding protein [Pseudooceanicola endophyticus]MXN19638.1 BMP family ABC transporter substrate-binding protein [Pseudooceanicola albus]
MLRTLLLSTALAGLAAVSAEAKTLIFLSASPVSVNDFLQLGANGAEKVAKETGMDYKIYESSDPTVKLQNLEAAAEEADIVVAITYEYDEILPAVAAKHPDVQFLAVDSCPAESGANVHCAVFREYEANFLAGAEAALTSETGQVGAIGALDIPFIHRYTDAFLAGAKYAVPDIRTAPSLWIGGNNPFADPAKGQQRGTIMASGGTDRILAAASGSNGGIYRALGDFPGAAAFGVDINQCPQAPGLVMDNVEKMTDVAVENGVRGILSGDQPKVVTLGLAEGGMTLTSLKPGITDSGCLFEEHPDVIEKVAAIRDKVISGEVVVADPMAQ